MADILQLLRFHVHDWLVLIALGALDVVLKIIHPFYRFVGRSMIDGLMYPLKSNTVPYWAVPPIAIGIPLFFFFSFFIKKREIQDLHHAVLGLLFSVLLTAVITDALKDGLGQPRPDFFWRCFPDGIGVYNSINGEVICHGDSSVIREGHKSFPSGHASWSFAGLGFLSLYISGKIKVFDKQGHVAKLVVCFLPLLLATFVGVSRIDDYVHQWQDVLVGSLLGLIVAFLCYRQFFPSVYDLNCMVPYRFPDAHPSVVSPRTWSIHDNSQDHNGHVEANTSYEPSQDFKRGRGDIEAV